MLEWMVSGWPGNSGGPSHPVAQADHPIEPLLGEHAQVLRALPRQVDPALLVHHPHCVWMQGLPGRCQRVRLDESLGAGTGKRFGHLRPGAVPVHKNNTRTGAAPGTAPCGGEE